MSRARSAGSVYLKLIGSTDYHQEKATDSLIVARGDVQRLPKLKMKLRHALLCRQLLREDRVTNCIYILCQVS
jgi:hypothetical protein